MNYISTNADIFRLYDMGMFGIGDALAIPLSSSVQDVAHQIALSGVEVPLSLNNLMNLAATRDAMLRESQNEPSTYEIEDIIRI